MNTEEAPIMNERLTVDHEVFSVQSEFVDRIKEDLALVINSDYIREMERSFDEHTKTIAEPGDGLFFQSISERFNNDCSPRAPMPLSSHPDAIARRDQIRRYAEIVYDGFRQDEEKPEGQMIELEKKELPSIEYETSLEDGLVPPVENTSDPATMAMLTEIEVKILKAAAHNAIFQQDMRLAMERCYVAATFSSELQKFNDEKNRQEAARTRWFIAGATLIVSVVQIAVGVFFSS